MKDFSIFSFVGLRRIRWSLYRYYYNSPKLFVSTRVTIETAHSNKDAYFRCAGELNIGDDVYIDYSGGLDIGEKIAISEGAKIFTHNHEVNKGHANWKINPIKFSPLTIEKYAWIGASAIILPSVNKIGEGSIIGAGAVVSKDTEPYGIYVGNPARLLKYRDVNEREA